MAVLTVVLFGGTVGAQPANDLCGTAVTVAIPSATAGTTVDATLDVGSPNCVTSYSAPGVWYSVVGNGNNLSADLCTASYDTKIHVYTGSCANLSALTCITGNDDSAQCVGESLHSFVNWCSTVGTTYLVLVSGFSANTGTFTLVVTDNGAGCGACCNNSTAGCTITPAADCSASTSTYQGDNATCTPNTCPQPVGACCNTGTGACDITLQPNCIGSGRVWRGIGTTCTAVTCYISVVGNDTCSAASLIGLPHYEDVEVGGAGDDVPVPCVSPAVPTRYGSWYQLTPGANTLLRVRAGASTPMVISGYTGPCAAPVSVGCALDTLDINVTAGTAYTFLIGTPVQNGLLPPYRAEISFESIAPPANDNCANATPISEGQHAFSTSAATLDGTSCVPIGPDVWFSYTPRRSGAATVTTCGLTSLDTVLSVYDGCGGTRLGCNDDNTCGGGQLTLQSSIGFEAHAGQTYLIQLSRYFGGTVSTIDLADFLVSLLQPPCIAPPSNMVAWWALDEPGPTAKNQVNTGDGAWTGNPTSAAGVVSSAVSFNAAGDKIVVTNTGSHNPLNYTIDMWIYPTAYPSGIATLLEQGLGLYGLFLTSTGELTAVTQACCVSRVYTTTGFAIPLNQWTFVSVTADSNTDTVVFYKNTVSQASSNAYLETAFTFTVFNNWSIGGGAVSGLGGQFFGRIDEVEFFDRALGATELNAIYNAGSGGKCKPCPPIELPQCYNVVPCIGGTENYFVAGCSPTDIASPAFTCANCKNWGDNTPNRSFGHTFSGLPSGVVAAALVINLCAEPEISCNDSISLQSNGGGGFLWGRRIGTGSCGDSVVGLLASPWVVPACTQLCLDLSALPNADGSTTNIIPFINNMGRLDISVQDDTTVISAQLWIAVCPGCTPPPSGMVLWMPLDEASGTLAHDIAHGHNGTLGTSVTFAPGTVAGGMRFPLGGGGNSAISIPNHSAFDFATNGGDWSGDCWAYWDNSNNHSTIFSRDDDYAWVLSPKGMHVHLKPTCVPGGPLGGAVVTTKKWHHLAITVDQNFNNVVGDIKVIYYIDGVAYPAGLLTGYSCLAYNSTAPQLIGAGTGASYKPFDGILDEVEIFNRVVSPSEIAAIYNAGSAGKCKFSCYNPWEVPVCPISGTTVTSNMAVCNFLWTPHTYLVNVTPIGGIGCTGPSPTVFSYLFPNPISITSSCALTPVNVTVPPGMAFFDHSCYRMIVTDLTTGQTISCDGSLYATPLWCFDIADCCTGINQIALGATRPITFRVTNTSGAPATLRYRIDPVPAGMMPGVAPVRLDGNPPGAPVGGTIPVGAGAIATIVVNVSFSEHDPFGLYELAFHADANNDGTIGSDEVLGAAAVQSLPPSLTGACCCGSNCSIATPAACAGVGRAFAGAGSACTPYSAAVPCCRGDYNKSGVGSVQDIFDFLAGYFNNDLCADSNDSGAISVQDIFDYLAAYFAGCS